MKDRKITIIGDMLLGLGDVSRKKWLTRTPSGNGWYNPGGVYLTRHDNKKFISCRLWENMQIRCTRFGKTMRKERCASYLERDAVDFFKNYQQFCEWFHERVNTMDYQTGFELDHNILVPGNKIYSPETCVFLPRNINRIITEPVNNKTGYVGVLAERGRYTAVITVKGKIQRLGIFPTAEEASTAYATAKIEVIANLAEEWKDKLSTKVYNALIAWRPHDSRN